MRRKAKGTWTPSGKRKIAVMFDPERFKQIAEQAARAGRAFSEQVRIYIAKGMGDGPR